MPTILPRSSQLCQNDGLSVLSSTGGKNTVGRGQQSFVFGQRFTDTNTRFLGITMGKLLVLEESY
jgi:hypothetical protein